MDDPAVNIRQPEIATSMAISEFFVIEAQHRQHRGVQVVYMHPVVLRPKSKLIRRPADRAALGAAAGHPHGETMVVVVASVNLAGVGPGVGSSTVGVRPNSPPTAPAFPEQAALF